MKTLLAALTLVFAASAFSAALPGQVKLTKQGASQLTLTITGDAASSMFDALTEENMFSIDAAESPSGRHTVYKTGKNYSCSLEMGGLGRKPKASCTIPVDDKKAGTVGQGAVG